MPPKRILIVGAGPTGLALANVLSREGVAFRIVEKAPAPSTLSKAIGVQAGTLEAIDSFFGAGAGNRFVASGRPSRQAYFHVESREPVLIDLGAIPSRYPFILILSQAETERLLGESLTGARVERGVECVSLAETGNEVVCGLRGPVGAEEWRADYVVGCDGAHSLVRHASGIPFRGGAYEGDFLLGDVNVRWPLAHGAVRIMISERGALVAFPMKGRESDYYRLIAVRAGAAPAPDIPLTLEELQREASALSPVPIELRDPAWLSRFRVHHRITDRFRHGRLFLAGDAAHIHSPAGGQGMNTGIQDAFNLGFRLAKVLKGEAPEAFLDGYERDRWPVARNVVRGTDLVFRQALAARSPVAALLRRHALPRLLGNHRVQGLALRAISELGVARREIAARESFRPG